MTEEEKILYVYHPHELTLKGNNRPEFEKQLTRNLREQMKEAGVTIHAIDQITGRHLLIANASDQAAIEEVSPRVFGIANYARCYGCSGDFDALKEEIHNYFANLLKSRPIKSFRVDCSRVDKRFPMQSPMVCKEIGAVIHEGLEIPVDLHNPELNLHIEILNDDKKFPYKFLYFAERLPGALGLPVGTSGKVLCLLSGGFDSPVATWMMMRRGCSVSLIHFHSAPYGEWRSSVSKIRKIVQQLHLYGGPTNFLSVPIGELQREIANKAPDRFRVTLYRRLMMRVAKKIAEKEKIKALATGDSLGQVASQTIESMTSIEFVIKPMLILRPLLAFCKEEIMDRARLIGTHDISAMTGGDCCSHMLPKRVATKPSIEETEEAEKNLNIDEMAENAILAAQKMDINDPWNEDEVDEGGAVCPFTLGAEKKEEQDHNEE